MALRMLCRRLQVVGGAAVLAGGIPPPVIPLLFAKRWLSGMPSTDVERYKTRYPALPSARPIIDTLELARNFERSGLTAMQAEGVARLVSDVVISALDRVSESYASKANLERSELESRSGWDRFANDFKQSVGADTVALKRDNERLRSEIDKVRQEIRWEVEKLTASQRLDLNLEKGRLRDEVARVESKLADAEGRLGNKLTDAEMRIEKSISNLRTAMDQSKSDYVKFFIGSLIALMGALAAVIRLVFVDGIFRSRS